MKDLSKKFLTRQEREQVDAAVKSAEAKTSGEIVCMIQSASYHYPMAAVLAATAISLPLALILTSFIGGWLWLGTQNMWLFLSLFTVLFVVFYMLAQNSAELKRRFISQREIEEEVEEAAVTGFFRHGLYRTRDATGVLIFISVFEHKVWVLADHGINAKIEQGTWKDIVRTITDGIRNGQPADAICSAVQKVGTILESHFPIKPDDTNELSNVLVSDD
jgi:putative membrane protein